MKREKTAGKWQEALQRLRRLRWLALTVLLVLLMGAQAWAAAPKIQCKLTDANLLALMKAYDSDAYSILKAQKDKGDTFTEWMNDDELLVDAVDTAVHEEFHGYTFTHGSYDFAARRWGERYYLGNGKTRMVYETSVFKTYTATKKIPDQYRTFRYETYVGSSATTDANTKGVYGLLNEFCAYYWGMHAMNSLYPYLLKYGKSFDEVRCFCINFYNDRDAYAEFYYWTLVYLEYARVRQPAVYKAIIGNDNYMHTFYQMRAKFRSQIRAMYPRVKKLAKKYDRMSTVRFWNGAYDAYSILTKQIQSSKYKTVRAAIDKYGK